MDGRMTRMARIVARGVALFALWMVLVDNLHQAELVTGAVVATVAALLGAASSAVRPEHTRLRPEMLRHLYRPFFALVTDTARVTVALGKVLRGRPSGSRLRAMRYRAVADTGEDRARRILSEWATSVSPNRVAIGIDTDRGYLLVHELTAADDPIDPLELG